MLEVRRIKLNLRLPRSWRWAAGRTFGVKQVSARPDLVIVDDFEDPSAARTGKTSGRGRGPDFCPILQLQRSLKIPKL